MLDKLDLVLIRAKIGMKNAFRNERGDVNVVAIVVLIAVAITLALLFKKQIANVIKTWISNIQTKGNDALTDIS